MRLNYKEQELYNIIQGNKRLTTTDIVGQSGMCKVTVLKYLTTLREKNLADYEMIGPAKLWSLKEENPPAGGRAQMEKTYKFSLKGREDGIKKAIILLAGEDGESVISLNIDINGFEVIK